MSHASDAATGQSIRSREEIVALVLDRRTGGYPDATTHAAMHGLQPSSLFEPVSLPIHGTYDEFGMIVPKAGQPALAQVLALANQPDWKTFQEKAFGVRGGIVIGKAAHGKLNPMLDDADGKRERVLGLAIFRKATWDITLASAGTKTRKKDVDTVLDRMAAVRALAKGGDNNGSMRNSNLLHLRASGFHGENGAFERLPELARALDHREGGDLMGSVAVEWMTDGRNSPLGYALLDRDADAETRRLLESIWELRTAELGFTVLGKAWMPSQLNRYVNQPMTFALGLSMIEETGRAIIARCEDFPEHEMGDRLEVLLAKVDAVRQSLSSELARVRAVADEDDAGPSGPSR